MAKPKDTNRGVTDVIALQPMNQMNVLPPDSGVIGSFLDNVRNLQSQGHENERLAQASG